MSRAQDVGSAVVTAGPQGARPWVAIMTDDPGWHGRRLRRAFDAAGYDSAFISLRDCSFGDRPGASPLLPGREPSDLPAGVFVRGVPGGTLPQVIHRLNILHEFAAVGVPVMNDGRSIERTVDKSMTTRLLLRAAIPTPPTWVGESEEAASAYVREELCRGHTLVLKPVFGSQGEGLRRIVSLADLPPTAEVDGLYYLQRFIAPAGRTYADIRVLVIAGQAVAAMRRESEHWVTNRAQGGRCIAIAIDAELRRLAEAAVRAVGAEYAGVDILVDTAGKHWVCEVNGVPAWYGLQRATGMDIAERLAAHLVECMRTEGSQTTPGQWAG